MIGIGLIKNATDIDSRKGAKAAKEDE